MIVADVIGTVVSSIKDGSLMGVKLLIVQPLDDHMRPKGDPQVAADTLGVGVGERAFCVLGREAGAAIDHGFTPIDLAVVGIVDQVERVPS